MRHRTKTVSETAMFVLTRSTNPKTGKVCYTVEKNKKYWLSPIKGETADALRDHFDPGKNRGSTYSLKWKFRDRKTAEALIMTAMLKFG
jgi:hypothetical protein